MSIGIAIRQAREAAGYSQDDLAYLMKKSRQYISKVERGCVTPQLGQILSIAIALDTKVSKLILDAEQIESSLIPKDALIREQHM